MRSGWWSAFSRHRTAPPPRPATTTCSGRAPATARRCSARKCRALFGGYRFDGRVLREGTPNDVAHGDHFLGASSTPAAVAGYPTITVPAGSVFGLPVGISFIGRAWSEPLLLKLAYAYEQSTRHRQPPTFPPTVSLRTR